MYNLGVIKYMIEFRERLHNYKVTGVSVGGWIAMLYVRMRAMEGETWRPLFEQTVERTLELADVNRKNWFEGRLTLMQQGIESLVRPQVKEGWKGYNGSLFIPVTELVTWRRGFMRYRVEEWFKDGDHLIDTLACSASIPGVQDWPMREYVDGAFLNNMPRFGVSTIRVSFMWFAAAEVKPTRGAFSFTPLDVCRPPSSAYILMLVDQGYKDAERYFSDRLT